MRGREQRGDRGGLPRAGAQGPAQGPARLRGPWAAVAALAAGCVASSHPAGPHRDGGDAAPATPSAPSAVERSTHARDAGADAQTQSDAGPLLGPPYPVVLAHGFFGFEQFAGAEFATYFYGVRDALAERGEPLVFTPEVDPFNDSTARGRQLIARIEDIAAETGHARVNVIGHSQGGLDARVAAHERPDLVASVTTVAAPHGGTPIADVVLRIVEDDRWRDVADRLVRLIGRALYDEIGEETSVTAALRQLSRPGIQAFNDRYTDVPGVGYFSIAGRTDRHSGGTPCRVDDAPSFIRRLESERDPVDPTLALTEEILDGQFGAGHPNDGLVRVEHSRWGTFLGCIPADHLDEVGHLFGDDPGSAFDHVELYADLIAWLRARGL